MCDYCGCRNVLPIDELSEDHERIRNAIDRLRRAVAGDDRGSAQSWLTLLQSALRPHLDREEQGIFSRLKDHGEIARYLDALMIDHARVRTEILAVGSSLRDWDAVSAALDALDVHIDLEEHDLFPAVRVLLDAADWAEVSLVHARISTPHASSGHGPGRGLTERRSIEVDATHLVAN